MTRRIPSVLNLRLVCAWTLGIAAVATLSSPVTAQLSRVGDTVVTYAPGGIMRGTDAAYDPANGVYLEVVGNGAVYGVFVNASGQPVSPGFRIFINDSSNWAHFPRVEYAAHAANGAGGFLVTWNHNVGSVNYVFGRIVSYTAPGYLASGIQQFSDSGEGGTWHETGPAMAYSSTSRRFLVAWRSIQYGIRGRFVDTHGIPTGGIVQLEAAGGSRDPGLTWNPATDEFGLVYTGFGSSGAFTSFRRIAAPTGTVSARTSFGHSGATFATGIDVNANNDYVLAWAVHPGTMSTRFDASGVQLTPPSGTLVTSRFGHDQALGIAFNANSQTLLAVGSDHSSWEVAGAEMTRNGAPISSAAIITSGATPNSGGSFHPLPAAHPSLSQWNVVYSRDFRGATNQIIAAAGSAPAPTPAPTPAPAPAPPPAPAPTSSCSTPDPFGGLGGGVCCNGGWLPPGLACAPASAPASAPAPTPAPAPSSAAPAVLLADVEAERAKIAGTPSKAQLGAMLNAIAWKHRAAGWGLSSKPGGNNCPMPDGTLIACDILQHGPSDTLWDVFSDAGGATDPLWVQAHPHNDPGRPWVAPTNPGGSTPAPAPAPAPPAPAPAASTCSTANPFAALGGGVCCNGGWLPPGMTCSAPAQPSAVPTPAPAPSSSAGCAGPDPFVSIGGGACVNGGWVPRGGG